MNQEFPKKKILAATRRLMLDVAAWVDAVYESKGSSDPIFTSSIYQPESSTSAFWPAAKAYEQPGGAGTTIEQSAAIWEMDRIVDCLNSNVWHGEPDDLRWSLKALNPLNQAVRAKEALVDHDEGELVSQDAAALFCSVLDAISAKVSLDMEYRLTLREISSLSGLAIKTVRMAAIGRDKNPDLKTIKEGKRTWVEAAEAHKWLKKKNVDFRRIQYKTKSELPVNPPTTTRELGSQLEDLRLMRSPSFEGMASDLNWDANLTDAYMRLESGDEGFEAALFDFQTILALAEYLCPDESDELVRRIDSLLRPLIIEKRLKMRNNQANSENK